jgi:hypothetical protein
LLIHEARKHQRSQWRQANATVDKKFGDHVCKTDAVSEVLRAERETRRTKLANRLHSNEISGKSSRAGRLNRL